jgi:hypothetical protein
MIEKIECLLCGKVYEETDAEIQSHFNLEHSPPTLGLAHYVIKTPKKDREVRERKVLALFKQVLQSVNFFP